MNDIVYITSATMIRFLLKIIPLGKIKTNRIVFCSFLGKSYSCNPKYLSEYIQEKNLDYEIVWGFSNPEKYRYLEDRGIKVLKYNSVEFIKTCLTSKYVVTNTFDLTHIPFSSKQVVINTWHGGGAYKKVGNQKNKTNLADQFRNKVFEQTPYIYLSSSALFTKTTIIDSFHHEGKILNCGMPRNDVLIQQKNDEIKERVYSQYNIPRDHKILLYAPTFREDKAANDFAFDRKRVENALKERFGGEWDIMIRMHYYVASTLTGSDPKLIDASDYDDMQELLYTADILVTDYSSSMWDFSQMFKPCLLYATDLELYGANRGFYVNIHEWPFPLSENNDELVNTILHFDDRKYREDVIKHHVQYGSYEKGTARKQVIEYLQST